MDGANVFVDTNVLLYAAGGSVSSEEKHERALKVLTENFGVSTQVLAEFYVHATRKGPAPLPAESARQWVVQLARKPCQVVDFKIVRRGMEISQRYQTSYWDGAIIAAAERLGCRIVYSEDLDDHQEYDNVTVINPFL